MKSDLSATGIDQHTTLISVASLLIDALEASGIAYRPVLEEAGFDVARVYDPSGRIPSIKYKKLWDLAVKYSANPCLGLVYTAYIQPSALHGLGLSWIASHSLKSGLDRLVRFQRILATDMAMDLREVPGAYRIYDVVGQGNDPFHFPDAAFDAQIATIFKISQIMLGPGITPVRVSFEHPEPGCKEMFTQFFGIAPIFNARETAIDFDRVICDQPAPSANPLLTRINDQVVIDYLTHFEHEDIVSHTRKYIIDLLPSGVPKQSQIASVLNMSLRSLQRRLSDAGTNFTGILNQVRQEMACHYLKSPGHQVIMITYLLGFSDPSNFSRAFKRWTGLSPQQYRQRYATAQSAPDDR